METEERVVGKSSQSQPTISLCTEFCDAAYSACRNTPLKFNDSTVGQYWKDSWSFCKGLFETVPPGSSSNPVLYYVNLISLSSNGACLSTHRECNSSDYIGVYSECINNERSVFYYKSPSSSDCVPGAPLPSPVSQLPCNIKCLPGTYLPPGAIDCQECDMGTYSLGGGYRFEMWTEWPTDVPFQTYCTNASLLAPLLNQIPCPNDQGWTLNTTYISSTVHNDSQSSVLEIATFFYPNASVRFQYKVDAEAQSDGLIFMIDNVVKMPLISNVISWTQFESDIPEGYHTLRWIYQKDYSISLGSDIAQIRFIELLSTKYSDPSCFPCLPGTFNNQTAQDSCQECGLGTIAASYGSNKCTPCNSSTYAYAGSTECLPREDCTQDDFDYYFTECSNGVNRTKKFFWLYPMICNNASLSLPVDQIVPCETCAPGTVLNSTRCDFCPTGYATSLTATNSTSNTSTSCLKCPAGTKASKALWFDSFDSGVWNTFTTGCEGDCGVDGWIVRGAKLSSGTGHGVYADVWLNTTVEFVEPTAEVEFEFLLSCANCHFELILDSTTTVFNVWGKYFQQDQIFRKKLTVYNVDADGQPLPLPVKRTFTWLYDHNDPYLTLRDDYIEMNSIIFRGLSNGGAPVCVDCQPGSFSHEAQSECTLCEPGSTSEPGAGNCTQCPENTYNPISGGLCRPCGSATSSPPGSSHCSDDCTFSFGDRTYDLSPLQDRQAVWGPLTDSVGHRYELSVCSPLPPDHRCSENPQYSNSHICQISPNNDTEYNLGSTLGFSPYYPSPSSGVVVELTGGTPGVCGGAYGTTKTRNTTILLLCDPSASNDHYGQPQAANEIENPTCIYSFTWFSLYACPLCSERDYSYIVGQCKNGQSLVHYFWIENPVRCHGGVTLPKDFNLTCSDVSTKVCGAGQYLDPKTNTCETADPGFYSIGPGDEYAGWKASQTSLSPFSGANANWVARDGYLHSGVTKPLSGDIDDHDLTDPLKYPQATSILKLSVSLVQKGSVSWDFQMYAPDINDGVGFWVQIDDQRVDKMWSTLAPQIQYGWVTANLSLGAGDHVIQWIWSDPTGQADFAGRERGVSIRRITVLGTKFASNNQLPCPAGTFTNDSASTGCHICPAQTFSTIGDSHCTPCSYDSWSLPGAASCQTAHVCHAEDYQLVYSDCGENLKRNSSYKLIQPTTCYVSTNQEDSDAFDASIVQTNLECEACSPGSFRNGPQCQTCQYGSYFEDEGRCRASPVGTASVPVKYYFYSAGTDKFPPEFSSSCTGVCATNGWRVRGNYLDSGFHGTAAVDSTLNLQVNLVVDGSISFRYAVKGNDTRSGLEFLIDSKPMSTVEYHPFTEFVEDWKTVVIPLTKGPHNITWNYHQEPTPSAGSSSIVRQNDDEQYHYQSAYDGMVLLEELFVTGEGSGGANTYSDCTIGTVAAESGLMACTPCPPGTFSADTPGTQCSPCGSQEYSRTMGSYTCQPCGNATASSEDHRTCQTNCVYQVSSSHQVNFENLQGPHTFESPSRSLVINLCNSSLDGTDCSDINDTGVFISHVCEFDSVYDEGDTVDDQYFDFGSSMNFVPINSSLLRLMTPPQPVTPTRRTENHSNKNSVKRSSSSFRKSSSSQRSSSHLSTRSSKRASSSPTPDTPKWRPEEPIFQLYFTSTETDIRPCALFETFLTVNCNTTAAFDQSALPSAITWSYDDSLSTQCKIFLNLTSLSACPVCVSTDYKQVLSTCSNDKQDVTYIKQNPCYGDNVLSVTQQSCDDGSGSVSISKITAAVAGGVFGLLTIVLIVLVYRHRMLSQKYDLLATHKIDELEMMSTRED